MDGGGRGRGSASPPVVLAMLLLAYSFNFLDRQILSILAQQVKEDLALSDGQMGALGGLAFALLFSTMAVPLGIVADRTGRARVVAWSLGVWSAFTALCGAATSFAQMFACRVGVGIGEAGGVAPSHAIIVERFPLHQRARAIAVYSAGAPIGASAGALFGAAIAAAVDWRTAFVVLGLAGIAAVLPFRLLVRDDVPRVSADLPPAMAMFARLAAMPVFWLLAFGAAASSLAGNGLAFWFPALLQRSFGFDLAQTGQFVGMQLLVTGVAGVLLGGFLGDRLGQRDRASYARVPAVAFVLCAPLFALSYVAGTPATLFFLLLVPTTLAYSWMGPVLAAVQHLVPDSERATASACFSLVYSGIGLGFGPLAIGLLSDFLTASHGDGALRAAMTAMTAVYLIAALFMALAAPRLRSAWRS